MKPLVIYHGPTCWDGFCCAWLMNRFAGDPGSHEFHAAIYGEDPPDVDGREVYVLDFSYPRAVLEEMNEKAKSLIVLDHHKTAQADLDGLPYCTFDMHRSGAQLTWAWLVEHRKPAGSPPPPWLVDYTADRDLWRWKLPWSREANAFIRSQPLDFTAWDAMGQEWPATAVVEGRAILRAEQVMVDDHVARAIEVEMDGHKVLSVNATVLFSESEPRGSSGRTGSDSTASGAGMVGSTYRRSPVPTEVAVTTTLPDSRKTSRLFPRLAAHPAPPATR